MHVEDDSHGCDLLSLMHVYVHHHAHGPVVAKEAVEQKHYHVQETVHQVHHHVPVYDALLWWEEQDEAVL